MPAPKREPSPHDSEPTMKTVDEDGEALHSNTSHASHINSLKRRTHHETTTPPRTKMKLCSSADTGDIQPAKSPKSSFSADDSSSSISDPPVKKAKLLIATSASSGEISSLNTYSKAPLKRAASTDSEDELSSDDSKTDLFRDKGDGDKARCIRKYANRVKGKRRAEESPSVPQERSQVSASPPSGTIKMDHNYGRFSHVLGFSDTNLDVRKENVTSVTKGERQELLIPSAQFEPVKTLCSLTLSTQRCNELKKCATTESKPDVLKDVENPKPTDKASVASCGEEFDSAAAMPADHFTSEADNEKNEHTVSVDIHECAPDKLQESVAKTLDSCPREAIQVGNSHSDGRTVSRETETREKTETLIEEIKTDVESSNAKVECESLEETDVPAVHIDIGIDDKVFSNDTHSESEKIQVASNLPSQTEVLLTSVGNADTCSDSSVVLEEDSKSGQVPAGLILETPFINTDLSHQIVGQPEENIEKSERSGSGTVVLRTTSAEVQLSLVVVDKTSAGYPEIMTKDCTAGDEQNQRASPCCDTDLELKTETCANTEQTPEQTPEQMSYLPQKQHELNYRRDEGASEAEVEETTNFELTTGPSVQIEIVEEPSQTLEQQVSNHPAPAEASDTTSVFNKDHGSHLDTVESQDEAYLERTTAHEVETLQTKTPSPAPAGEIQTQSRPAVGELVTDMSAEEHPDVISKNSEVEKNEGISVFQSTDGLGGVCTRTLIDLDVPSTVQIQKSPEASEDIRCTSEDMPNPLVPGCLSSNNGGSVAADVQERMTSDDFSRTTVAAEIANQQSQNSADKDHECLESPATKGNENENAFLAESDIPAENCTYLETTAPASGEALGLTDPVMVKVQTNQEISEVPAQDRSQTDFNIYYCKDSVNDTVVDCIDATNTESQMVEDVKALPEEIDLSKPAMEIQKVQEMGDLNTEAQKEPKYESCETKEENSDLGHESADNPAGQVRMETQSTQPTPSIPSTLEVTSDAPPTADVQTQDISEVSGVGANVANKSSDNSPDENTLCADAVDSPRTPVSLEAAETLESCSVLTTVEAENKENVCKYFGTEPEGGSEDGTPKEDKPTTEHVHIPMDTTPAPEELPEASPAAVIYDCGSPETSEPNSKSTANLLTPSFVSTVDQNKSASECFKFSEAPTSLGSAATLEMISDPTPAVEKEINESPDVSELNTGTLSGSTEGEAEKGRLTGESVDSSESQTNVECTLVSEKQPQKMEEVSENQVALYDEIHAFPPVATSQSKDDETVQQGSSAEPIQVDIHPVSGFVEGKGSGSEEETVIDKVVAVPANKPETQATSYPDRSEENEQLVIACHNTEEGNFAILPSAEQKKTASLLEVQKGESQVVYEPISSPESSGDAETPVVSENHEAESYLEMQKMAEDPSVFEESRDVCTHVENTESIEQQTQIPPSRNLETEVLPKVLPESCVEANMQNDTDTDVKQVAVVCSDPDSSAPGEGELANSESNGYPDFARAAERPEQEINGLQEGTGGAVVTVASDILVMEDGDTEFVTLEPVPQSEIDFDIVTRAAAESGLSVSYTEEIFQGGALTAENKEILNSSQLVEQVRECKGDVPLDEVQNEENQVPDHDVSAEEVTSKKFENGEKPAELMMDVDVSESNKTTNWTAKQVNTSEVLNLMASANVEADVPVQEVQVLQDIELGHEIVVGITDDEGGNDICVVEKPQKAPDAEAGEKSGAVAKKRDGCEAAIQDKKPKKQEMNTQARTKARLAALAEQKAAASKRSANKQQLNLLALCQEIAEDIATDSMLLQRIEEEKQAAAATAAAVAAKSEHSKEEPPATSTQEAEAPAATPTQPAEETAPTTPAIEAPTPQPPSSEPGETKKEATTVPEEPPKRRFFVSQVSVPLKAHEKKKLTRYQRLRQVELQREKMSWARVKKLKSDQASQALSDMDWQAPLHAFSQFSMGPTKAAEASPPVTPPPAPQAAPPSKPIADSLKVDDNGGGAKQIETPTVETTRSDTPKAADTAAKNEPLVTETRKSPRQSKTQAAKEMPPSASTTKVTRSSAKRALPAVPPPMPNGVGTRKQKPVEYTPYKPRPKYTFADFELDDDPVPVAALPRAGPPARPPQQAPRPTAQGNPTGRPRPAAVPTQLPQRTSPPAGQVSAQSRPTAAIASSPQQTPSNSKTPQSKAVSTEPSTAQLKQATSTAPRPATSSASTTTAASSNTNNCKVT